MRHILFAAALALTPLAVAAGPSPFVNDSGAEIFGYYMPVHAPVIGPYKLILLGIGPTGEFRQFAKGERWGGRYAPVLLEFAPAGSQPQQGEGGPSWAGSWRVLPNAFAITRTGQITFSGTDRKLGAVSFTGKLDIAAIKAEGRDGTGGTGKIVLTGDLTAGGKVWKAVRFTWFGGD